MDRKEELKEAQEALEHVLEKIRAVNADLSSAQNWGLFDIFAGEFLTSLIKRSKIDAVNQHLTELRTLLEEARTELADLDMNLLTDISNTGGDLFFDVWFDNIFTDFRVQGELKEVADNLNHLEKQVSQSLRDVKKALLEES